MAENTQRDAAIVKVHAAAKNHERALTALTRHANEHRTQIEQGWHVSFDYPNYVEMDRALFSEPFATQGLLDFAVSEARAAGATQEQISTAIFYSSTALPAIEG